MTPGFCPLRASAWTQTRCWLAAELGGGQVVNLLIFAKAEDTADTRKKAVDAYKGQKKLLAEAELEQVRTTTAARPYHMRPPPPPLPPPPTPPPPVGLAAAPCGVAAIGRAACAVVLIPAYSQAVQYMCAFNKYPMLSAM